MNFTSTHIESQGHPMVSIIRKSDMPELQKNATAPSYLSVHDHAIIATALSLLEEKRLRRGGVVVYERDFQRYLTLRFAGLTNEQLQVFYMSVNDELLHAEVQSYGDATKCTASLKKMIATSVQVGAAGVVIAHNHPDQTPDRTPSKTDVATYKSMKFLLEMMDIKLIDSFVVTSIGNTSIRYYSEKLDKEEIELQEKERKQASEAAKARRMEKKKLQLVA